MKSNICSTSPKHRYCFCLHGTNSRDLNPQNQLKLKSEMNRLRGFCNPTANDLYTNLRTRQSSARLSRPDSTDTPNALASTATTIIPHTPKPTSAQLYDTPTIDPISTYHRTEPTSNSVTMPIPPPNAYTEALVMVTPKPTQYMKNLYEPNNSNNPYNVPNSHLKNFLDVPNNYEESYFHNDSWCRDRWRDAINLELNKMLQLNVWHTVLRSTIPQNCRCIKSKWVFDYSPIPGINFLDYYSPVINDTVFHILIIIQLMWNLNSII
jgi:hypothetical protein